MRVEDAINGAKIAKQIDYEVRNLEIVENIKTAYDIRNAIDDGVEFNKQLIEIFKDSEKARINKKILGLEEELEAL